jgi:hypothetical protein
MKLEIGFQKIVTLISAGSVLSWLACMRPWFNIQHCETKPEPLKCLFSFPFLFCSLSFFLFEMVVSPSHSIAQAGLKLLGSRDPLVLAS